MLLIGRRLILRGMEKEECWRELIFVFGFEGIPQKASWLHGQAVKTSPFHGGNTGSIPVGVIMASWLSWLERRPVTAEVVGSSPIGVVKGS